MKKVLILLAFIASLASADGQCYTDCVTYPGGQTCTTECYGD